MDPERAGRFIHLLTEVTNFAEDLLRAFNQPITKLVETTEQIAERKRKAANDKCRHDVQALIRANMKGLRVGQERQVEVPAGDLLPIGHVEVADPSGRKYSTIVTSNRTISVLRTA